MAQSALSKKPAPIIDVFRQGHKSISFSPSVSGTHEKVTAAGAITNYRSLTAGLEVKYQQFRQDNYSVGLFARLSYTEQVAGLQNSRTSTLLPNAALGVLVRRYLPVSQKISFYGSGAGELGYGWVRTKYAESVPKTLRSTQQIGLNGSVGIIYVFAPRWSVDLDARLLQFQAQRNDPLVRNANYNFTLSGISSFQSFSVHLTHYF
ncbi:hypothetical protein [Tellurirhabdus bombi]|uniref:hypothetical protein n=1 Tax=Tellurirhabdus bombi TaxID=2907205 RepID=UPI001F235FDE|nr:hypothetical protein [Tellurirhabdus bombi]